MRTISKGISWLFQPLLIPFYNLLLLSLYTDFFTFYKYGMRSFLLPVIILTFVIPSMFILILRTTGYISDFGLAKSKERTLPYLIFIFTTGTLFYIFTRINVPYWFLGFIGVSTIVALIGFIINFFFRISTYMLAMGALIATVIFISFVLEGISPLNLIMVLFLIAGIVGVARLYLEKETPTQIYIGFLIGFLSAYLYFYLFTLIVGLYFVKY